MKDPEKRYMELLGWLDCYKAPVKLNFSLGFSLEFRV